MIITQFFFLYKQNTKKNKDVIWSTPRKKNDNCHRYSLCYGNPFFWRQVLWMMHILCTHIFPVSWFTVGSRLVYLLRKSTEFHVNRTGCQRIHFHFLLLIFSSFPWLLCFHPLSNWTPQRSRSTPQHYCLIV